jgi:RimJ/RimL family protein N-acetyltransferase
MIEIWKLKLKDGREVTIRLLAENDKEGLFQMFSSMSEEALQWSMAPYTREGIDRWISNISNLISLVAEHGNRIVGYTQIYRFSQPRRKGIGEQLIYLHQDFHNVGLGTAMMEKLLQLAKKKGMHKIDLSVVADNKAAIQLYRKLGFTVEGVSKDSYFGGDQKYHDLVNMGLKLD